MKIQVGKVVSANDLLAGIKEVNELEIALSWKIDDVMDLLKPHAERYSKEKEAILQKLGKASGDSPGMYSIPRKNFIKFEAEMKKIDEIEVEIKNLTKLSKEELIASGLKMPKGSKRSDIESFIE